MIGKATIQRNPFKRLCCVKLNEQETLTQKILKNVFCFAFLHKARKTKSISKVSDKIRELINQRRNATDVKTKLKIDEFIT